MPQSQHSLRSGSAFKGKQRPFSAAVSAAPTRPSSSMRGLANSTKQSMKDFQINGSAISLHQTPKPHTRNKTMLGLDRSGVLSVKDLLSPDRRMENQASELLKDYPLKMDDEAYVVPKYSWKKNQFLGESREKKLDYICLFPEKVHPRDGELTKIHAKRKNNTPGPTAYETTRNWAKKSHHDYENQKGKQYRHDRKTDVSEHIEAVKREKLPAPNAYKPQRQSRIHGPVNYGAQQLQMVDNARWYGKQTPGHCYKPDYSKLQKTAPRMLYFPRTKPEGGGPGLQGIKRDQNVAPGYYKINHRLTERSQRQNKFSSTPNRNYIEKYVKSKEFVPGAGKYKDIEKGLKLQTRPLSCGGRKRIT